MVILLFRKPTLDAGLTRKIIGAALEVHRLLGPGFLESAYDVKLECGYRIEILVERRMVVEFEAIENIAPIHEAVVLTRLKLPGNRAC